MNNGTREVKVIKPTLGANAERKLRVAAYCRVSTDSSDQINSFIAQMRYYSDYIRNHESMVFVDIYADEGITGTCINKRDEFHQMLMLRKILINYIEVGGSKTSRAKRNLQHQKCPKPL